MSDGTIRTTIAPGGVGVITIDREAKRNALTPAMIASLSRALAGFDDDGSIGAIVLTGAGERAFCAGHDIKALEPGDPGHLYEEAHMQVFLAPRHASKPVIAAVNGAAYAGGFCLALNSDLRIATPEASFAVPGVRLGIVPIAGQSSRLAHLLPPAIANDMCLRGAPLDSQRALQFGFINEVVPASGLVARAIEMGAEIAAMSPFAVAAYKRIVGTSLYEDVAAADALEYRLAGEAGRGPDVREGLAAFAERRTPDFRGKRGGR